MLRSTTESCSLFQGKITSKTVSLDKAEKIKRHVILKRGEDGSPLRFWVKTKKFEILSYPDLNLHDVLPLKRMR